MDTSRRSAALKAAVVIILCQIKLFPGRLGESPFFLRAGLRGFGQTGFNRLHPLNQRFQPALGRRRPVLFRLRHILPIGAGQIQRQLGAARPNQLIEPA